MPSIGQPSIENRLVRVELAVTRLEGQVSQLVSEFAGLKERVEDMLNRVDDHQSVLYGVKGKSGLIAQSEVLEELKDALKGVGKEAGLIAEIQTLTNKVQEWEDGRKWLTRLVVGAVLADVVINILRLF